MRCDPGPPQGPGPARPSRSPGAGSPHHMCGYGPGEEKSLPLLGRGGYEGVGIARGPVRALSELAAGGRGFVQEVSGRLSGPPHQPAGDRWRDAPVHARRVRFRRRMWASTHVGLEPTNNRLLGTDF